jgi:hypothetical protein
MLNIYQLSIFYFKIVEEKLFVCLHKFGIVISEVFDEVFNSRNGYVIIIGSICKSFNKSVKM